jgi:hypothetical protein
MKKDAYINVLKFGSQKAKCESSQKEVPVVQKIINLMLAIFFWQLLV